MSDPEFIDPSQIRQGPIRHETLDPMLLEQIRTVYDVLGQFFNQTLEQFELGFMRDTDPEHEVVIWTAIMVVWIDYHEQYLDDVVMSDADEKKLLAALISISAGVDDPSKLDVPAKIGQRLLDCYSQFEKEVEAQSDDKVEEAE